MTPRPATGALLMTGGCVVLTINDAAMKALVAELPIGQLVGLRAAAGLAMLVAVTGLASGPSGGLGRLVPRNPGPVLVLTALMVMNYFLLPFSLRFVPLADALILANLSPVLVAALSPWLLGERVGIWRWSAIALGLAGAALVIAPEGDVVGVAMLGPVAVSVSIGIREILTRRYIAVESVLALVAASHAGAVLAAMVGLPAGWVMPEPRQWGLLLGAAALVTASQVMITAAFRHGDAAVISCLKYSTILWAALLGWVFWREALGALGWLGAALIILSGVTITLRSPPPPGPTPPR